MVSCELTESGDLMASRFFVAFNEASDRGPECMMAVVAAAASRFVRDNCFADETQDRIRAAGVFLDQFVCVELPHEHPLHKRMSELAKAAREWSEPGANPR